MEIMLTVKVIASVGFLLASMAKSVVYLMLRICFCPSFPHRVPATACSHQQGRDPRSCAGDTRSL